MTSWKTSRAGAYETVIEKAEVTKQYATTRDLRRPANMVRRDVYCRIFESPAQFRREADLSRRSGRDYKIDCLDDADFTGRYFEVWDDVMTACVEPWTEGIAIIERLAEKLDAKLPQPVDRRRRQRWDEYDGDDICLDRLRGGTPFWRQTRREWVDAPQNVTLLVDVSTLAEVEAQDIFWRGAAALVAAKHLEECGFRAEIWAVNATELFYPRERRLFQAWRLKSAEDGLNLGTLAVDLSGWFYRSIVFQSRHSTKFTNGNTSVGGSQYIMPCMTDLLHPGERSYLVDLTWSEDAAHRKVEEILAAFQGAAA